jgi:glutamate formiminotransferase
MYRRPKNQEVKVTTAPNNCSMLIQCIPNISEGRREDVIAAIVAAISATSDVRLVDWSADRDHNRMVATFVGGPGAVSQAVHALAEVAIASIDMTQHTGVHPRLGALDVLPLVPLRGISMAQCADLARDIGRDLANRLALPIFLYEESTPLPEPLSPPGQPEHVEPTAGRRLLPYVRKNAFNGLLPDFGPSSPHPTAGATVVGARGPLIAYNIILDATDPAAARAIARDLRNGGLAGFTGVRALGLPLPSRRLSQVSTNITDPKATGIGAVYAFVCAKALELGVGVVESEVIGAMPGFAAFDQLTTSLHAPSLRPGQVLWENWPDAS